MPELMLSNVQKMSQSLKITMPLNLRLLSLKNNLDDLDK